VTKSEWASLVDAMALIPLTAMVVVAAKDPDLSWAGAPVVILGVTTLGLPMVAWSIEKSGKHMLLFVVFVLAILLGTAHVK